MRNHVLPHLAGIPPPRYRWRVSRSTRLLNPSLKSPDCRRECKVKREVERIRLRQKKSRYQEAHEAEEHEPAQSSNLAGLGRLWLRLDSADPEKRKDTSQVDEHKYAKTN